MKHCEFNERNDVIYIAYQIDLALFLQTSLMSSLNPNTFHGTDHSAGGHRVWGEF